MKGWSRQWTRATGGQTGAPPTVPGKALGQFGKQVPGSSAEMALRRIVLASPQEGARLAGGLLQCPPIMRLLAVCAALLATPVMAQLTLTLNDGAEVSFPASSCSTTVRLKWTVAGTPCSALRLWSTTGTTCGNDPGSNDVELLNLSAADVTTAGNTREESKQVAAFFAPSDGGQVCGAATTLKFKVCGHYKLPAGISGCGTPTDATPAAPPTLIYDGQKPSPPTVTVTPLDSSLSVRVTSTETDLATYTVKAAEPESGFSRSEESAASSSTTVVVDGLTNDTEYEVTATATDKVGNVSDPSEVALGVPITTFGAWEKYKDSGGQERGGCGAAGSGMALLSILGVALIRWFSGRRG